MNIFVGILIILAGCFFVIKTEWLMQNIGSIAWAEEHMGSSGGSRLMYKLIGLGAIILSVMGMTGMLGEVIVGVFGRLFGLK